MRESLVFIAPTGDRIPLTGQETAETEKGVTGRFMPPVSFIEEETFGRAGARIRNVKIGPREIPVPQWFRGDTDVELRQAMRQLVNRLLPTRGDGQLENTGPDGEVRLLTCRYSTGLSMNETKEEAGVVWQRAVIVFRAAEDPYWYAAAPTELDFATGPPPTFFPIFPLRLARSSVFGGVIIDNPGDVEAWPIWTITGPGANLTILSNTTGESLALDTVLAAGDEVVIDTRPGVKTVTRGGVNLYGDLADDASLFALVDGPNDLVVELDGATEASAVSLSYRPAYLAP